MNIVEKYPLLIGHSPGGLKRLNNIREVADFICQYGQHGDLVITKGDGTWFLNTFGIYIDRIADMAYREALLKVLVPMQMELDGTNAIDGPDETEPGQEMEVEMAEEQRESMDGEEAPVLGM